MARRLAGRDNTPQIDDEAARAAIALGVPESEVNAAQARNEDDTLGVWPENWRAVRIAIMMQSQWRVGPGGAYGWDYNVLPIIDARTPDPPPESREDKYDEFSALQIIEAEMVRLMRAK